MVYLDRKRGDKVVKRTEILNMSRDELTELVSDALMVTLLRGTEENNKIIPDGIKVQTETENLNITFDINVEYKVKTSGIKAFKDFINNRAFHIYRPGEL